jgi:hypothetical protein
MSYIPLFALTVELSVTDDPLSAVMVVPAGIPVPVAVMPTARFAVLATDVIVAEFLVIVPLAVA